MFFNPDFIPASEAGEFRQFIREFKKNDFKYKEGEAFDGSFYLIRSGSVGVYRTVSGEECLIDFVRAVNFVGEIEILVPGPRIGSVKILSDSMTSYRFERSDLRMILIDPVLSDLLLTRLTGYLKNFSDRYVNNENSINRLLFEKENTNNNLVNLFSVLTLALNHIPDENLLPERCSVYLKGIRQMIQKTLALKLPELSFLLENDNSQGFRNMYEENLIPEELAGILIQALQNR